MSISTSTIPPFSIPKSTQAHQYFHPNKPISRSVKLNSFQPKFLCCRVSANGCKRNSINSCQVTSNSVNGLIKNSVSCVLFSRRPKSFVIKCCKRVEESVSKEDYYELLGVSVDSNPQTIKEAYRKLQKKYHPDIAGQKGHEYTLKLNEAYGVLMKEELRREYDSSIGKVRGEFGRDFSGLGYSSWKGPLRSQALFVDETACIGCRECVHHARSTFTMDESLGCARVKVQFGDDNRKIEVSVDSCPVNCIHWVDRDELAVLEFLVRPQPKEAYGVFGGGWERPSNVFMAAKFFNKQLTQQDHRNKDTKARVTVEEETPAQAKARANASVKLQMEKFSRIWSWVTEIFGSNR